MTGKAQILICLVLLVLSGCAGQRPFRMIQICLGDAQNVASFKDMARAIARSERMEFVDGSAQTEKELVSSKVAPDYSLIYIGVRRGDGIGFEAGNLGLSAYEVALGFSEGSNPTDARRFADLVVRTLQQRWQVHDVPTDQGASPMCREKTTSSPSG